MISFLREQVYLHVANKHLPIVTGTMIFFVDVPSFY